MAVPIAGFMLVIDKSAWPFIIALSLPLIAARYLPTQFWLIRSQEGPDSRISKAKKLAPLFLVGATIFALNTAPKKLIETKKCEFELAGKLERDLPLIDQAACKSVEFILQARIDL